jgi:hypothetical protein
MVAIRYQFSFVVFLLSISAQAYFESITVWRSPEGKLVYGVGDSHGQMFENGDGEGVVNMLNYVSQRKIRSIFTRIAFAHKQQDYLAIVEDSSMYPGPKEFIKRGLRAMGYAFWHGDDIDSGSSLTGLTDELEYAEIPSINAEYRFLRIIGCGLIRIMLLKRGKDGQYQDLTLEDSQEQSKQGRSCVSYEQRLEAKKQHELLKVSGHEVVQEFEDAAQEADLYTDRSLTDYYRDTLHKLRSTGRIFLDSLNRDQEDIVKYFKTHIEPQERDFLDDSLSLFDASLLDMRVLHNIVTHPDIKKQLLFCGAGHIEQVGSVLKKLLGYKQVAHVGAALECPELTITFDPAQQINYSSGKVSCFELKEDLYDIIKSDDPERFSAGSFS